MKLLHTSDVLLGQEFSQVPQLAKALREARLETLQEVIRLAGDRRVDAVVLAGNTLASIRCSHQLVTQLSSILQSSRVPVYLWPGKTDLDTPECPYVQRKDLFEGTVQVLQQARLPWSGPAVGVGCGDRPPQIAADYIAMGGSPTAMNQGAAHWSGTLEGYDYAHGRSTVNIVSFPGPTIEKVPVGRFTWREERALSLDGLARRLQSEAGENQLLRLYLSGSATLEDFLAFEKWRNQHPFTSLEVVDNLRLLPEDRYRHPLLKDLARRLHSHADPLTTRHTLVKLHSILEQLGKEDLV